MDTKVRYRGRTAVIKIFVNTNATSEALGKRLAKLQKSKALRDAKLDMVVITMGMLSDEEGKRFWEEFSSKFPLRDSNFKPV